MANETEARVSDSLLTFIDFLYAVVFGLIVAGMFSDVLTKEKEDITRYQKAGRLLMVIAAFYFLSWDWLPGRLLTLKNPYTRYSRFFLEIIVAACAYGVAFAALQNSIYIFVFIALMLFLGSVWARMTLIEYPNSQDRTELLLIQFTHFVFSVLALGFFIYRLAKVKVTEISVVSGAMILLGGWLFVFIYEFLLERREKGILAGPGVPFVSRKRIENLNQKLRQKISALRAKKGD